MTETVATDPTLEITAENGRVWVNRNQACIGRQNNTSAEVSSTDGQPSWTAVGTLAVARTGFINAIWEHQIRLSVSTNGQWTHIADNGQPAAL